MLECSDDGATRVVRAFGTTPRAEADLLRAEAALADFVRAMGVPADAPATRATPRRMARAYAEFLTPRAFELTTFDNDEGYDELVLARSIPVRSVCEHHFLPFAGVAHVGYYPGARIVGLSKLARVVEHFACRPQVQERLTRQVALELEHELRPSGVGVVIEASHSCMTLRGARSSGSTTVTSTLLGTLRDNPGTRREFLSLLPTGMR